MSAQTRKRDPLEESRGSLPVLLAAAIIAVCGFLAYGNGLSAPFVFDDIPSIVNNPTIRSFSSAWFPPRGTGLTVSGRPVLNASFWLDFGLHGLNPAGCRAFNIAIHVIGALVLFGIARRSLLRPSPFPRAPVSADTARSIGLAAALIWLLHPLQTESVTYIVQRAESLAGLFYLLTIYCFIRGTSVTTENTESAEKTARPLRVLCHENIWSFLSVVSCLLGMGCKEVVVTAPVAVLLYDRTFEAGSFRAAWARRWGLYLSFATAILLLAAMVSANAGRGGTAGAGAGIAPTTYALTQCQAVVRYLWLALWPHPLVFDYGTATVAHAAAVWPQALLLALLAGTTALALWQHRAAGFLGAWFLITLAPSSSFVPVATQTAAEHRMYLPLAAIAVLAAIGIDRILRARAWILVSALALGLGCLTGLRNHDYRSEQAIWEDTAARCPANPRAHASLGNALAATGETGRAAAEFREALRLDPACSESHTGLGSLLAAEGRLGDAMRHFSEALRIHPDNVVAHYNLGNALAQSARPAEAIEEYRAVLQIAPDLPEVHANLANALQESGRLGEAVEHYQQALALSPDQADFHFNLGLALVKLGRRDAAREQFDETLRLRPGDPYARAELARLR